MNFLLTFLGLILLAEGWKEKIAQANWDLDRLQGLLMKLQDKLELADDDNGFLDMNEQTCNPHDEIATRLWLRRINEEYRIETNKNVVANWNYESDIRDDTQKEMIDSNTEFAKYTSGVGKAAHACYNPSFSADTVRQLKLLSQTFSPHDPEKLEELAKINGELTEIYANAVVVKDGKELQIEPELTEIMAKSRNVTELQEVWESWRDVTGVKMKTKFQKLVELQNQGARDNNYNSLADVWLTEDFDEIEGVEDMCDNLWNELKPLYLELQTHVYRKLKAYHRRQNGYNFPSDGTIPAHLLGNMWAQDWSAIFEYVKPYDIQEENQDDVLKNKGYTPLDMFKEADMFFTSLGMKKMTDTFWNKSIIVKPTDRNLVCHASAWDFFKHDDFRIKMCTVVTMDNMEVIHHEMGHIQYSMNYQDQPTVYRRGASGAFHEAIGDTIALSVRSSKHLCARFGVSCPETNVNAHSRLTNKHHNYADLNYLMRKALIKLAFLPFGYLIDKYRWEVFRGTITADNYNTEWWRMRRDIQRISPPSPRGEEFFDPGAKYHVAAGVPYIRYFISFVMQFQLYQAMCDMVAGHDPDQPLYQCDFFKSTDAGAKLKEMLKLGGSKSWQDALELMTGSREVNTRALQRYFKPLIDWLKVENRKDASLHSHL